MISQRARALLSMCFSAFLGYGILRTVMGEERRRISRVGVLGYSLTSGLGVTAAPVYLTSGACGSTISHWHPLVPLIQTWAHIVMGGCDDHAVKILFPTISVGVLALPYETLRRFLPGSYKLTMLLIVATIPTIVVHFPGGSVASGYADIALALFFTAVTGSLIMWVIYRDMRSILIAALPSHRSVSLRPGYSGPHRDPEIGGLVSRTLMSIAVSPHKDMLR
jgi:hypothetical protein